jgi:hypothetical protein
VDDPRVLAHVARGRRGACQRVDHRRAADLVEPAELSEVLADRQHVDLAVLAVEVEHRAIDDLVLLAVEVVRLQAFVDDEAVQRRVREQDRPEHRLLGFEVVRRGERVFRLLDGGHAEEAA